MKLLVFVLVNSRIPKNSGLLLHQWYGRHCDPCFHSMINVFRARNIHECPTTWVGVVGTTNLSGLRLLKPSSFEKGVQGHHFWRNILQNWAASWQCFEIYAIGDVSGTKQELFVPEFNIPLSCIWAVWNSTSSCSILNCLNINDFIFTV